MAYSLADAYVKEYKKYDFKTFNPKKVEKTKWWPHFLKAADQRYIEGFDPNLWVKCQFEKHGKIFPFALIGKKAEETFNEYKFRFTENNDEIQMLKSMLLTHKALKNKTIDLPFIMKVKRGFYSLYYLSIFKPFRDYNKIHNIIDEDKLNIKRAIIYKNNKIKNKLQNVLKNDFY